WWRGEKARHDAAPASCRRAALRHGPMASGTGHAGKTSSDFIGVLRGGEPWLLAHALRTDTMAIGRLSLTIPSPSFSAMSFVRKVFAASGLCASWMRSNEYAHRKGVSASVGGRCITRSAYVKETVAWPANPRVMVSEMLCSVANLLVPTRIGVETSLNCWNRSITS